jgi:hypothetical protein
MQQPVRYNKVLVRSTLSLPQLQEYFSPLRHGFLTFPCPVTLCFQGCRKDRQQIVLVVVLSFGGYRVPRQRIRVLMQPTTLVNNLRLVHLHGKRPSCQAAR